MTKLYKYCEKFSIYLFPIVVISSLTFLVTLAEASTRTHLRGEIWYGNASWYGRKFHGKKTSNGEKYNKNELTAAHKYLPFNTKVLVTNLKNNKSVIVRINDRGPFIGNRIIDLSEEAAEKIDVRKEGIAYIKLQVLNPLMEDEKVEDPPDNI